MAEELGSIADEPPFWSIPAADLLAPMRSSPLGLASPEAVARLRTVGSNVLGAGRVLTTLDVLLRQLRSPLLLLLVFATLASVFAGQWLDATIVLVIVLATVVIGFTRESGAEAAVAALAARVAIRSTVMRDGEPVSVASEDIVPGDVILLSAGSLVPADGILLESDDFYVSEAALTGESFAVLKSPGSVEPEAELAERTNCVFFGTNVCSGTARCVVVNTGESTHYASIAHRLASHPPETGFERGMRRFGQFLTVAMLLLVLLLFVVHVFAGRPPAATLLFAIALAVGLSPELLPAILTTNLARAARAMANRGVLVRRLNAIENLGSMDVLCTDKTGTLTEGVVQLEGAYDPWGVPADPVLDLAALNAEFETGIASPLDDAILNARRAAAGVKKLGEIPFDFVRKRVSVAVEDSAGARLVTKGAFHELLQVCTHVAPDLLLDASIRDRLEAVHEKWTRRGIRVVALAVRPVGRVPASHRDAERNMTFAGFVTFLDRPRAGVDASLAELAALGVSVKLITGDSGLVARHVASLVGLPSGRVLTGHDLSRMSDEALAAVAEGTDLFVEADPGQKERIILALRRAGHVVGFLGDGVNDAPAMHAADTSLSVEQAVDVARAAADFVLLERGLEVIRRGIEEGRRTFANTIKYAVITTSANLGNMVSMAVISLFLPYLPLTASQILLNNFLSDVPAVGIASDRVDPEMVARPGRWDFRFIGRSMVTFGVLSSAFDFLTFAVLLFGFRAGPGLFRTGWFVESLLTELVVALVLRTRRPVRRSRPGTALLILTLAMILLAFAIPYLPFRSMFGFEPLPATAVAAIAAITASYVLVTELQKKWFYRESTREAVR